MNTLVVIPTYNERDNLDSVVGRLLIAVPDVHVLIVDDGSPDGTGEIADELARRHPCIHVLHRTAKSGLGAAYRAGMAWALERNYETVVEMDADGSHRPEELPHLLAVLQRVDVALGSRWAPGGRVIGWPLHRRLLSQGGSAYARILLRISQRDATGGYRAFRADALRRIRPESLVSEGYGFQVELLWRAVLNDLKVQEVPITFVERTAGRSKMSARIVFEAIRRVTIWGMCPPPRSAARKPLDLELGHAR